MIKDAKLPTVVKISDGGSSLGVYIVETYDELVDSLEKLFEMDDTVIMEEYIKGIEYTCGVFNDIGLPVVRYDRSMGSMIMRINIRRGQQLKSVLHHP